jgi:hypothetical protein
VDFIGGQSKPPTKEEQLAISTFIKKLKENIAERKSGKNQESSLSDNPHEPV